MTRHSSSTSTASSRSSHGAGRTVRTAEKILFTVLFGGFLTMAGGFAAQLGGGGAPGSDSDSAVACVAPAPCAPQG